MIAADSTLAPWLLLAGFLATAVVFAGAGLLALRGHGGAVPKSLPAPVASAREERIDPLVPPKLPEAMSGLQKQLAQAGFDDPQAVRYFLIAKVVVVIFAVALGVVLVSVVPYLAKLNVQIQLITVLGFFMLGYFLPTYIVDKRRAAYFRRISVALPDALDFMLVCVEAGQSVDLAVKRVSQELKNVHPEMAARFTALTEWLAAGADRHEAFMRLAQETDNDDLRQFAAVIVQSTSLGTPIAQTLRVVASDLRDRRVRKIEERANILPTKITLGTMLFTVPPLLILLLAPAIYRITQSFLPN